jgi:hypothetical protein
LAVLVVVTKGAQPPRLPLALPSILLGVVFALGLFSILPLRPPLAHPLWSYVPGAPASISLDPVGTRLELIKLAGLAAAFLIGAGCLTVAAVFAVHGLVDFAFEEPSMAAFFSVILGLGFGLSQRPAGGRARR